MRSVLAALAITALSVHAQAQQKPPAAFDLRVTNEFRNDLAGLLIKFQLLQPCDVACHLIIARTLIALDTAAPVQPATNGDPPAKAGIE
jgi:hypothetical protein